MLSRRFLELRRVPNQAAHAFDGAFRQFQHHELITDAVLVFKTESVRRSKAESAVISRVAENHDKIVPRAFTAIQPLANQARADSFPLRTRQHGDRSQSDRSHARRGVADCHR